MRQPRPGNILHRPWLSRGLVPILVAATLPWLLPAGAQASGKPAAFPADGPAARIMTVTGTTVAATRGTAFSGPVATFSLGDSSATPSQFAASINWGDATT